MEILRSQLGIQWGNITNIFLVISTHFDFCAIHSSNIQVVNYLRHFQSKAYWGEISSDGSIAISYQCTEVRFASFLSGGFTTMVVINPPERKLAKRTLCSVCPNTKNEMTKIFGFFFVVVAIRKVKRPGCKFFV